MPFSHSSQLSTIVGFIEEADPGSVLDVGVGMGQYGVLARHNLESLNLFDVSNWKGRQRSRQEWKVRIDGIEGFAAYLTPVHEYAYDEIRIGDALDVLPTIEDDTYELVLAIDILEHLEEQDGARFLEQLRRVSSKYVLVSTPKVVHRQVVFANPYENHRSSWSTEELGAAGYDRVLDNTRSWIVVHEAAQGLGPDLKLAL